MRLQAVKAIKGGQCATDIAKVLGLNRRTVYEWMAKYLSGGQKALMAKPIAGRPPKLTTEQMQWIAKTVGNDTPLQYEFEFALWTLKIIGHLVNREFGLSLSVATVSRVMKLLGFTPQKPLYQAWLQDEKLVRQWEQELYPLIRKEQRRSERRFTCR